MNTFANFLGLIEPNHTYKIILSKEKVNNFLADKGELSTHLYETMDNLLQTNGYIPGICTLDYNFSDPKSFTKLDPSKVAGNVSGIKIDEKYLVLDVQFTKQFTDQVTCMAGKDNIEIEPMLRCNHRTTLVQETGMRLVEITQLFIDYKVHLNTSIYKSEADDAELAGYTRLQSRIQLVLA